jgi:hypothetical protein
MATKKQNNYITADLDFAEIQIEKWRKYLEDNPYDEVQDRKELLKTKTGGAYYAVVATKEAIQKSLRETTKEYLAMVDIVKKLRENEEARIETRGKSKMGVLAEDFISQRK